MVHDSMISWIIWIMIFVAGCSCRRLVDANRMSKVKTLAVSDCQWILGYPLAPGLQRSFFVTSSDALVTSSEALVTSSIALVASTGSCSLDPWVPMFLYLRLQVASSATDARVFWCPVIRGFALSCFRCCYRSVKMDRSPPFRQLSVSPNALGRKSHHM